jgi:hypothetical protein
VTATTRGGSAIIVEMGGERRWLLVLACALACAQGSSDTARGSAEIGEGGGSTTDDASTSATMSVSSTTADESPMNCVPGQQIACACPGGTDGAQACLPDGTGYAPCECPGSDSSEGTTTDPMMTTMPDAEASGTDSGPMDCASDCTNCTLCAVQTDCTMEYEACNADDGCLAMINCAIMCGTDTVCVDACQMMMMASMQSLALFDQLRSCVEGVCMACVGQ